LGGLGPPFYFEVLMSEANGKELYKTQSLEHVKQFVELDGQGRSFKVYTCGLQTPVGGPCSVTIYGYINVNSTAIDGRVETQGVWTQIHQDKIDLLLV